ncbi:MAG: endonuclease domain-containing protein [Bacteroidales bacterium]|nr:endonuclease domain-containing protein [Bacteroidales bacterium]
MAGFLNKTTYPDRYGLLKDYAKENRKNMTEAERVLWNALRDKLSGIRFRRQHPIGDYIVDFICLPKRLVIEVDGGYHSEPRQQDDDEVRTANLNNWGYRVIRFSNEEVLFDLNKVIEKIVKQLYND